MAGLFGEDAEDKENMQRQKKRKSRKESDEKKMPEPESFEDALKELEDLVENLDSGDVPLEESVELFMRAQFLAKWCQEKLDKIEGKLKLLVANDMGGFDVEPLDSDDD